MLLGIGIVFLLFLSSLLLDVLKDQLSSSIKEWFARKGVPTRVLWIIFLIILIITFVLMIIQEISKNNNMNSLKSTQITPEETSIYMLTSLTLPNTPTSSIKKTATPTVWIPPTATLSVIQKMGLTIADFYDCINYFNDSQFNQCRYYLSDRDGEMQTLLNDIGGNEGFIEKWSQYLIDYNLVLCSDYTILAEYMLFDRNIPTARMDYGQINYARFLLGKYENRWRIAKYYDSDDVSDFNIWREQAGYPSISTIQLGCDPIGPNIIKFHQP